MKFESNLKFDEIILRYGIIIILGIATGVTQILWIIIPMMYLFMESILGYSPIKQRFTRKRT
ncbi:MAG TPA: hypothetical protein VFM99_00680 [Chitinophagales bacterium]|nr:hypothetical protein [Chitinophagales bacterium]